MHEDEVALKDLIEILNDRFGTDFKPEDQLFVDHVVKSAKADQSLQQKAKANALGNFSLAAKDTVQDLMVDGMERHEGFVTKFLNEDDFRRHVYEHMAKRIWDEIRGDGGEAA